MKYDKLGKIDNKAAEENNLSQLLGKEIVIYHDRYTYSEKHRGEYKSITYESAKSKLKEIVTNPDIIFIDESNDGFEFIKNIGENVMVAVRLTTTSDKLKVKSFYPISESKLERKKFKSEQKQEVWEGLNKFRK